MGIQTRGFDLVILLFWVSLVYCACVVGSYTRSFLHRCGVLRKLNVVRGPDEDFNTW